MRSTPLQTYCPRPRAGGLPVSGAAPRGGRARRLVGGSPCPSSSPRARTRALPWYARSRPAPPAGSVAPCGASPRGRRRVAARASPSSGARARRRSCAAAPRLPAPAGAGVLALAPLRCAAGCAAACPCGRPALRSGSLTGRPPSAAGSLLGCGRSGGAPQPRGRVLGLGPLAAAPPAGPLAPPGGGARGPCSRPRRVGGLARCGAPPRCAGAGIIPPPARGNLHQTEKRCNNNPSQRAAISAILKLQGAAINLATHVPTMAQGYRLRAALLGGSLLILILYVLFVGDGINVSG